MLEQVQALQVSRQVRQREPWQEPVQARSRASPERLQEQVQALQVSWQVRRREPWQEPVQALRVSPQARERELRAEARASAAALVQELSRRPSATWN